jgi:hypothetical protein
MTLDERRSRLRDAREALSGFSEVLHQASGPELAELAGLVDEVSSSAGAVRAEVTLEVVQRGEVCGGEVQAWLREHAPSLRQSGAAPLAAVTNRVAAETTGPGGGPGARDADSATGIVWEAVVSGGIEARTATAVLREVERLTPRLVDEAVPTVTHGLVGLAHQWGPALMRRLRPKLLAQYGQHGVVDDLQERLVAAARLSSPHVESGDLTEYQLWMTPEQAAVLEAAIGPMSAPQPNDETGERDLRPAGQRRVEALADVCRRSSALDAAGQGSDGAAGSPATVHVTIDLRDLEQRTGAAEVLGSTATGTLIAPETLRRIACDAELVPHVLGTDGEDLDLGRVHRLFTPAQRRRLWRRDGGCTFPGCTAPAAWTRAHHVVHWADGGDTGIDNAALLCQRHHSTVHSRRLRATVARAPDDSGRYVVWDLTDGSYDRHLEERSGIRRARGQPTGSRYPEMSTEMLSSNWPLLPRSRRYPAPTPVPGEA